ncbi:carboxypeptidase-like regulatory domain-containing protein [Haloparvum sedimenti]|uniref:carboxypeptidase-like regulatory domain-containing protein n=1 Tax=Haloparvum sedimenti TaxID=1678448 RepID=UPI000F77B260|nr:carboxypeptidase-like regulatory domain-containing protein [Haloparvum sedimenti]
MGDRLAIRAEVDHYRDRRDKVSIEVTDRNGDPVPTAEIIARNEETGRTHDEEMHIEHTDSRGECQFRIGDNARYRYTARKPGFVEDDTSVYVHPRSGFGIDISVDEMHQQNPFSVFIHDQGGEPISDARVDLETTHTYNNDRVSSIDSGRTGPNGRVRLEASGSGTHAVQVSVENAGEKTKTVVIRPKKDVEGDTSEQRRTDTRDVTDASDSQTFNSRAAVVNGTTKTSTGLVIFYIILISVLIGILVRAV